MLTINDRAKGMQWEITTKKEETAPKVQEMPKKPVSLPVDVVVLQTRVNICGKEEEEYLVATYWG